MLVDMMVGTLRGIRGTGDIRGIRGIGDIRGGHGGSVRPGIRRGAGDPGGSRPMSVDQELSSGRPGGLTWEVRTASLERFQAASHLAY